MHIKHNKLKGASLCCCQGPTQLPQYETEAAVSKWHLLSCVPPNGPTQNQKTGSNCHPAQTDDAHWKPVVEAI